MTFRVQHGAGADPREHEWTEPKDVGGLSFSDASEIMHELLVMDAAMGGAEFSFRIVDAEGRQVLRVSPGADNEGDGS